MAARVVELVFEVICRTSVKHLAANVLLQLPTTMTDDKDIDDEFLVSAAQHHTHIDSLPISCNCRDCDNIKITSEPYTILITKADDMEFRKYLSSHTCRIKMLFVTR